MNQILAQPSVVLPDIPFEVLVRKWNFSGINENVKFFPSLSGRPHPSDFQLFHFDNMMSNKNIEDEMKEKGCQSANHYELLL